MAFFDNRKKKKDADVMATVLAPEIPADQPEWFVKAAVDMPSLSIFKNCEVTANSWINVEVAAAFVGSRIPPQCQDCDDASVCKSCGKAPDNYIKVMTANQDSDWLVWNLSRSQDSRDMKLQDGFFSFFDSSVYSTFDTSRGLAFSSQKMVPVRVGSLKIKDTGDGSGRLFMADAFAAVDSHDFIAGVDALPGEYQVVAFIGYTSTGDLAPMALGAFGPALHEDLARDIAGAPAINNELKKIIEGSSDSSVMARFGNHQEHYAEVNRDFEFNNGDISWQLQLLVEQNEDDFFARARGDFGFDDFTIVAYALHMRGKKGATLKMLDLLEERLGSTLSEIQRKDIAIMRALEPGVPPQIFHVSRKAIGLQTEGERESAQGNVEAAQTKYLESAMLGNPNALGSYTWTYLLAGNCQGAIDGYEKAKKFCIEPYRSGDIQVSAFHYPTVFSEIANCDSNYALCKLGTGAQLGEAISIWEPNLETGHTETRFFLSLAQHKVGEYDGRDATLRGMSDAQWEEMDAETREMSRNASGFFKTWCSDGAALIRELKR